MVAQEKIIKFPKWCLTLLTDNQKTYKSCQKIRRLINFERSNNIES